MTNHHEARSKLIIITMFRRVENETDWLHSKWTFNADL